MNRSVYVDCFVTNTCITRMPSESTINSRSFLQLAFRNNRLCYCFWQTSIFEIGRFCIVTAHQWRCEKVMFSVVCVCQSIFSKGGGPTIQDLTVQRSTSPDMFKLFHYEACTVNQKTVGSWHPAGMLPCFWFIWQNVEMSSSRRLLYLWATLQA